MDCLNPNAPTSLKCLPFFVGNITDSALILAGVLAVFFVSFAGIKFLTSGGDPQKVESAKKTLTFAIVGLLIILLSFTILKIVARVTNTNPKTIGVQGK